MVFTTFLIPFGSGMVVTNVVWYWYEFDCLIPEGSRDMGSYGEDMGSCDRERYMFAHFRFAGLRPALIPQHIARQTQQWAQRAARHHLPVAATLLDRSGSPAHTGEMGVLSAMARGVLSLRPALHVSTCIFVRREAPYWQWHCKSCGMRMDSGGYGSLY